MLPFALAELLLAGTSSSSDEQELSFESTWTEEFCRGAARAATVGPGECDVETRASDESGAVSARAHLVSPYHGRAPWKAGATARSDVVATYELTEPVPELDFEIRIRANEARVAIAPNKSGTDYYDQYYNLGRSVQIYASAAAEHSTCSKCVDGTNDIVLSTWQTGETLTTSGEDVVLHLNVDGVGGEPLPAGEVTIEAGVSTSVRNGRTWGDDSASIDAVVEKIALR